MVLTMLCLLHDKHQGYLIKFLVSWVKSTVVHLSDRFFAQLCCKWWYIFFHCYFLICQSVFHSLLSSNLCKSCRLINFSCLDFIQYDFPRQEQITAEHCRDGVFMMSLVGSNLYLCISDITIQIMSIATHLAGVLRYPLLLLKF